MSGEPRQMPDRGPVPAGGGAVSLDRLVQEGTRIEDLTPEEAARLLPEVSALALALSARLQATAGANGVRAAATEDELLTAAEAARRTGMSPRWLYAHAKRLAFARRVSARAVRFSARGLEKWLAARKA